MARGQHSSPQTTKYPKRRKSQKKLLSLLENNRDVLKSYDQIWKS